MTLPKDRLRKIYGIPEPTGPADQEVLARRRYHEAAAIWLAKSSVPLQVFFASVGFFVILLPVLSKPWRNIIEGIPILSHIFHSYSTLSGMAMVHFYFFVAIFLLRLTQMREIPWRAAIPLTYRDIVDMEIYPRTKKEEFAYWADALSHLLVTTAWLFLPFGVLAYFINIRS